MVATKPSAPFQMDYLKCGKRVTRISKEAPKVKIPQNIYGYGYLAHSVHQKLNKDTSGNKDNLLEKLRFYMEKIGKFAKHYKATGDLPADWEYDPNTVSSWVSTNIVCVPAAKKKPKPKKNIPRNPHIDSAPLGAVAEKAWLSFKKLDENIDKPTRLGLPSSTEELKTRLRKNNKFVTYICDFAVEVFNDSCQMYRNKEKNNKNISHAKVVDCKYLKVQPNYIFYMTIQALEQGKMEVYKVNLRCDLDNGAIVLDKFCRTPEPSGDFTSLEFIYETVKDDLKNEPELCYHISGLVRRTKGGYDFYNPCGWNRLEEWDDD